MAAASGESFAAAEVSRDLVESDEGGGVEVPPVVAAEKGVGELVVREVPDEETNEASPALVKREASPSVAPCDCQQVDSGWSEGRNRSKVGR